MPSRMERYYETDEKTNSRTQKNRSLYNQIYEDKQYTNVEGIVETPVAGSIDIQKIKEIINSREIKKKREKKEYQEAYIEESEELETKNYDINDVLDKAKGDRKSSASDYHSLKNVELNILKGLKIHNNNNDTELDENLNDLINTITNTSMLNKLGDKELSLDLLDDLKSSDNNTTIIGGSDAIRNVLKNDKVEEKEEMDHSFYTKSLNLDDDLEGLRNPRGKKINKILLRICTILSILVVVGVIIIIFLLLTKK